jgi:hypothetical protein
MNNKLHHSSGTMCQEERSQSSELVQKTNYLADMLTKPVLTEDINVGFDKINTSRLASLKWKLGPYGVIDIHHKNRWSKDPISANHCGQNIHRVRGSVKK